MRKHTSLPLMIGISLFLWNTSPLFAQKQRVIITDSGELYSTYVFTTSEEEDIKNQVSAAAFREIMDYHTEDSWPSDIGSLKSRESNRPAISSYIAYQVAKTGNKAILYISAKKNKKLPEGLRPKRDFYFVIGTEGIRY